MIIVGSDHGGLDLKNSIIPYMKELGYEVQDLGTYTSDSVDYPDIAKKVCAALTKEDIGILVCGTGIGISIAANKIKGIRAALCSDVFSAQMAREHNDANVICLGGRVLEDEDAFAILDSFFETTFAGGRHAGRVQKIMDLEC